MTVADHDAEPTGAEDAGRARDVTSPASRPRRSSTPGGAGDRSTPASPRPRRADARAAAQGSFLRELPVLLLIAFVLAFLLRTFVLQVFFIPSISMEPTLMVDDRMVVEKVTYRFREPRRGEIVVFEGDNGTPDVGGGVASTVVRRVGQFLGVVPASAKDFVKRVIGLPGDEVLIDADGQVFVNGVALDEPYKVEEASSFGPVVVPDGHLFFLGDNRPHSSDSRRAIGYVERDAVVGRAVVIIFPLSHAGRLTGIEHDVPDPSAAPLVDAPTS